MFKYKYTLDGVYVKLILLIYRLVNIKLITFQYVTTILNQLTLNE